jgi:hypothetical protein
LSSKDKTQAIKYFKKYILKELCFLWQPECRYFFHPSFLVLFYFSPSSLFLLLFHQVSLLLSCCACPRKCIMLGITITLQKNYGLIVMGNELFS